MKSRQKTLVVSVFLFFFFSVFASFAVVKTASAAFYDKKADCEAINGVWWENRCWAMETDAKQKCNQANGQWHTVPLDGGAPYAVSLALADPAGYCDASDSPDDPPGPDECRSHLVDAVTGECSEYAYCKKFTDTAKRNACMDGYVEGATACASLSGDKKAACEDGANNGIKKPDPDNPDGATPGAANKCEDSVNVLKSFCGSGVMGLLGLVLDIMTAGVGVVAVGGIAYGALRYTTAGGSQEQVKQAVSIIQNVVIGLVAYIALYAFLQFLIPGGAF